MEGRTVSAPTRMGRMCPRWCRDATATAPRIPPLSTDQDGTSPTSVPGFAIFFRLNCSPVPWKALGKKLADWQGAAGSAGTGCLGEDGVNKYLSALAPRLRVGLGVPSLGREFGGQQGFACLCFCQQLIPVDGWWLPPVRVSLWRRCRGEQPPLSHPARARDRGVTNVHKMFYSSNCK